MVAVIGSKKIMNCEIASTLARYSSSYPISVLSVNNNEAQLLGITTEHNGLYNGAISSAPVGSEITITDNNYSIS